MKKILLSIGSTASLLAPIAGVISCKSTETKPTLDKAELNTRSSFIMGNAWYTGSAEMLAMAQTEYNQAKRMFDTLSKQAMFDTTKVNPTTFEVKNPAKDKAIPVVFMDIDETVLSNISYQNYNVIMNKKFSPTSWTKWVNNAKATPIAGAIEFIKYVWTHGGVVMFNSNRTQSIHKAATQKNLISAGLDQKMVNDWNFWMQGIDETNVKPWNKIKTKKSPKENRMNAMNSNAKGYDLTSATYDNNVVLKTVMRVGDNLDDFNDNATHHKINKTRREVFKKLQNNFGATNALGKIYDIETKTFINETWNEGYVLIGGNSAYGGWESGIKEGYFKLKGKDLLAARIKALHELPIWNGKEAWDGTDFSN